MKKLSSIIHVQLVTPIPKAVEDFSNHSWILSAFSTFKSLEVIGYLAEGVKKDASLGKFFSDIEPKDDGTFDLELGVTLADLFPNLDNKLEYLIYAKDDKDSNQEIAVSNQMAKIRYKVENEDYLALVPRYGLDRVDVFQKLKIPEKSPVDLLKTTVSWRTIISGTSADEALEKSLVNSTLLFINFINRFTSANLALSKDNQPPYLIPAYSFSSLDFVYFIIRGKVPDKLGHGRITNNIRMIALNPDNYDSSRSVMLSKFIAGELSVSPPRTMLQFAWSFFINGNLPYALLQMAIAAEVATTRYVHNRWIENGVSKSKLKDYERDITYAQMLNIHLYSLVPLNKKPDTNLIGDINRTRDLRNEFMHEGNFTVDAQEIERLFLSTSRYLEYIESL